MNNSNKTELIEPDDRKGFYSLSEIKRILEEVGTVRFINNKGKIKTVTSAEVKKKEKELVNKLYEWLES